MFLEVMVTVGLALELPNSAITNELACEWLFPPVDAFIASVRPVTFAFLPIAVDVLSVRLMWASALLSSKPPPLSDLAPASLFSDVFESILMFPPALIVVFEALTVAVVLPGSLLMPEMLEKSPMPAVLLSVPLISESTLGIETRPPEPFSVHAVVFVTRFVVIQRSPPIVIVVAATYALRLGPMFTVADGSETSPIEPPPPVAEAPDLPSPTGGCAPRSELVSRFSSRSVPAVVPVSWMSNSWPPVAVFSAKPALKSAWVLLVETKSFGLLSPPIVEHAVVPLLCDSQ